MKRANNNSRWRAKHDCGTERMKKMLDWEATGTRLPSVELDVSRRHPPPAAPPRSCTWLHHLQRPPEAVHGTCENDVDDIIPTKPGSCGDGTADGVAQPEEGDACTRPPIQESTQRCPRGLAHTSPSHLPAANHTGSAAVWVPTSPEYTMNPRDPKAAA